MVPRLLFGSMTLAAAMCVGPSGPPADSSQGTAASQQQVTVPTPAQMESELLAELNAERERKSLQPVRLMAELVDLARRHSAEMARRNVFSHDSEAGKSYQQRLTDARVAFVASGENLSRSSTFLTRLIHQSLMESPPHRENILSGEFDSVGIGVASRDDGTYFVTMDFIKSVPRKSKADIRTMMLGALNDARTRGRHAPIVLTDAVNRIADQLAEAKASGGEIPQVPPIGRRSTAMFVTGVDLEGMVESLRDVEVKGFGLGGIGSTFGPSRKYPDGEYVVCVILVWDGT